MSALTNEVPLTVEALLFDMDGTLVDSTELVESIWTEFAARHGLDAAAVIAFAHGRPTSATVDEFLPATDVRHSELELIHSAELAGTDGVREIPGAAALMAALPPNRVAIVTSASRAVALTRLEAVGIAPPDVLITATDVTEGKPSPEGYNSALTALKTPAANSIIFEDAEAGILAGLASGATTVVVGEHRGAAAEGLLRVPDFRAVSARTYRRGVELSW